MTNRHALYQEWKIAGDQPEVRAPDGTLVRPRTVATAAQREEARAGAEVDLSNLRESRRSVLSELNAKAQTYGTIQAGTTALFGFGLVTIVTAAPKMVLGAICIGIGIVLSIIALGMLRWMAITGNTAAWTKPNEDVGLRTLRETRFDRFFRAAENCNDMIYVVQKRRRLFMMVAVVSILGDIVAFGGVLIEALTFLF